jgi:hypothetical protein
MNEQYTPLEYPSSGHWFDRAFPWNGWMVSISTRGRKRRFEGIKEFEGRLFTIKLTIRKNSPPIIGLVNLAAACAAEDGRILGETARADYWMAVHRLMRQDIKTKKGGVLVPDEIAAREKNIRIFRESAAKAGEDLPLHLLTRKG